MFAFFYRANLTISRFGEGLVLGKDIVAQARVITMAKHADTLDLTGLSDVCLAHGRMSMAGNCAPLQVSWTGYPFDEKQYI